MNVNVGALGVDDLNALVPVLQARIASLKKERAHAQRLADHGQKVAQTRAIDGYLKEVDDILAKVRRRLASLLQLPQTFAPGTRTLEQLSREDAIALLHAGARSGNPKVQPLCTGLLELAGPGAEGLRLVYTKHVGGNPDRPDYTAHITVRVGEDNYHLKIDKNGAIFDITPRPKRAPAPWTPPGAFGGGS